MCEPSRKKESALFYFFIHTLSTIKPRLFFFCFFWESLREIVSCHQEKKGNAALDWSLNSLADQGFANFRPNHPPKRSTDGLYFCLRLICILLYSAVSGDNPAQCDQMGFETLPQL